MFAGVSAIGRLYDQLRPGGIVLSIAGLVMRTNILLTVLDSDDTPMGTPHLVVVMMTSQYHHCHDSRPGQSGRDPS